MISSCPLLSQISATYICLPVNWLSTYLFHSSCTTYPYCLQNEVKNIESSGVLCVGSMCTFMLKLTFRYVVLAFELVVLEWIFKLLIQWSSSIPTGIRRQYINYCSLICLSRWYCDIGILKLVIYSFIFIFGILSGWPASAGKGS
jgi:hypothetical protein